MPVNISLFQFSSQISVTLVSMLFTPPLVNPITNNFLVRECFYLLVVIKTKQYSNMDPKMYLFAPVVIETSGVFGKQTLSFLKDLACCVRSVSEEVI